MALAVAVVTVLAAVDVALDRTAVLISLLAAGPVLAGARAPARPTAMVSA